MASPTPPRNPDIDAALDRLWACHRDAQVCNAVTSADRHAAALERGRAIEALMMLGWTSGDVARELDVSPTAVYKSRRRLREAAA